jgi:carboxymethylenebutenolidase
MAEKLDATVIYYGHLTDDVEQIAKINGPVLGIFGEKDTGISVESVQAFEATLTNLKKENNITLYPGVGHAFANPTGANYSSAETLDAWDKTLKFLETELKK